jgi:hypothetical protein
VSAPKMFILYCTAGTGEADSIVISRGSAFHPRTASLAQRPEAAGHCTSIRRESPGRSVT